VELLDAPSSAEIDPHLFAVGVEHAIGEAELVSGVAEQGHAVDR